MRKILILCLLLCLALAGCAAESTKAPKEKPMAESIETLKEKAMAESIETPKEKPLAESIESPKEKAMTENIETLKEKPVIICTSFPCYDLVRAAAGDTAEVVMLIRPGAEVHGYEPTPTDMKTLAGCDLFVYIGGESDVWVDGILESFGDDAPQTLRLFDCVEALEEETTDDMTFHEHEHDEHDHADEHDEHGHEEGIEYDEHIWTSPLNAAAMAEAVGERMAEVTGDPSTRANAEAYAAQIRALDDEIRRIVDAAPRDTLVFADRFPLLYFVREFGLNYAAAFPSCTSESEPSAHTVAALIDRVKSEKLPVVFALELSSGRVAKTIAEETGGKVRTYYSIQNISNTDFERGETYLTLMRRNVESLKEALN